MSDITIFAIPGSLRASSINAALVRAATALAPDGVQVETFTGLRDLPCYDATTPISTVTALTPRCRASVSGSRELMRC